MGNVFVYNKSGVCSLVEPASEVKREKIKEAIDKALETYRRHSVFTVAVSKKGLGCFDCIVIPRSSDLPRGVNPAAFNYAMMYKNHWQSVPDNVLDQLQEWYL